MLLHIKCLNWVRFISQNEYQKKKCGATLNNTEITATTNTADLFLCDKKQNCGCSQSNVVESEHYDQSSLMCGCPLVCSKPVLIHWGVDSTDLRRCLTVWGINTLAAETKTWKLQGEASMDQTFFLSRSHKCSIRLRSGEFGSLVNILNSSRCSFNNSQTMFTVWQDITSNGEYHWNDGVYVGSNNVSEVGMCQQMPSPLAWRVPWWNPLWR